MTDYGDAWIKTIDDFNQTGNFSAVLAIMDEDFVIHTAAGVEVAGREAVKQALEAARDQLRWTRHDVVSSTSADGWLVTIFRSTYDDKVVSGSSVVRFNEAGRPTNLWVHQDERT